MRKLAIMLEEAEAPCIWIDNYNFGIIKIAGDLAKSPSFWVKQVHFVCQYLRIGEFWLPPVRVFERESLTVDYYDYAINGASNGFISAERSSPGPSHSRR
jgi:hypothetical protein